MPDNNKKQLKRELAESSLQRKDIEDKLMRTENLLSRYSREFIILDAAIKDISRSSNFGTLIKTAVDIVLKASNLGSVALYLIDEATGKLVISSHTEVGSSLREALDNNPLTVKFIEKVIETGHVVTSPDLIRNPTTVENQRRTLETEDIETLIGVPLKSRDQIIGIIVGVFQYKREFSTEDIGLLETLGCLIGAAIHNTQLLEKMGKSSLIDDLTGLYNDLYLEEVLETEIDRSLRCGNSFSLIMMGLDGFKTYIDKFGRQSGDCALGALARTLKSELRKLDIACQCGGDEFSIVLPATDAQKAQRVVDRIRAVFLEMLGIKACHMWSPLGLSAGISQFPQAAVTAQDMIYLADSALWYAKKNKGNKSVLISDLTIEPISQTYREAEQIYSLVKLIERRELFTLGHAKNVSKISGLLGKAIGLSVKELHKLHTAAFLHDIGKSRVPASLLTKPDKLTREEWEIMKNHSLEGARLVARAAEFRGLVPVIKHHHEKYDGSGYPNGLKGDKIPLLSRIICVADSFDSMIRYKSYSVVKSSKDALNEICKCSGTQFDPKLVSVLVAISGSFN